MVRLHERVYEIQRMVAHPTPERIITHAEYWADCEAALSYLREKGWAGSLLEIALAVPKAR